MKLNKDKWFDSYEYDLAIAFDNQDEFDNFNDFVEHSYTVYADNYEQDLEDLG